MHNINTCSRVLSTVEVNEETKCDVQQNFKADRDWLVGSEQNSKGDRDWRLAVGGWKCLALAISFVVEFYVRSIYFVRSSNYMYLKHPFNTIL
jgi:hypothetical protein